MSKVSGLYRLGLRVPSLKDASGFYRDIWAMHVDGQDGDRIFFRSTGEDHSDLVLSEGERQLDHIGLLVGTAKELAQILKNVSKAGHSVPEEPRKGHRPGEALVAALSDPDGTRIELIVPSGLKNTTPAETCDGLPRHMGHIVLWTPQLEKQEAFYALLGFQVSDRTHIGMSFLRCNTDHHSIALARSTSKTGLQHVAFDIGSVNEVMRESGRLRRAGVECIWGVGRHGPGNNVFAYYNDPAGNVVEFYGDMETVESAEVTEPRFWGPEHKGDIWGIAGAPPLPFRD